MLSSERSSSLRATSLVAQCHFGGTSRSDIRHPIFTRSAGSARSVSAHRGFHEDHDRHGRIRADACQPRSGRSQRLHQGSHRRWRRWPLRGPRGHRSDWWLRCGTSAGESERQSAGSGTTGCTACRKRSTSSGRRRIRCLLIRLRSQLQDGPELLLGRFSPVSWPTSENGALEPSSARSNPAQ